MDNCCPLCGQSQTCHKLPSDNDVFHHYYCAWIENDFFVSKEIEKEYNSEYQERIFDLISEMLLRQSLLEKHYSGKKLHFYVNELYEQTDDDPAEYVNLKNELNHYPKTLNEKIDHALINLSIMYPNLGDAITMGEIGVQRATFDRENNNYDSGMLKMLKELNLLSMFRNNEGVYTISAAGWQRIDKITKQKDEIKQGFVAMSFKEETNAIREAFKIAISASGYTPRLIDEKEHNNQIVPEIFYEIERSKFVVVDVTYPNYGAYYEAGYAQALGKQVIMCCRKAEFDAPNTRPHFDVAQKSMIVWENEADLVERLKKRIEATVK